MHLGLILERCLVHELLTKIMNLTHKNAIEEQELHLKTCNLSFKGNDQNESGLQEKLQSCLFIYYLSKIMNSNVECKFRDFVQVNVKFMEIYSGTQWTISTLIHCMHPHRCILCKEWV